MLSFHEIIDSFVRTNPNKVVGSDNKRKLSYLSLANNGNKLANYFLDKGIYKSDRIALLAYNCIEFAEIMHATSNVGAIFMPVNFRLSTNEIMDIFIESNPKLFIYQKAFKEISLDSIKYNHFLPDQLICIVEKKLNNNYYKIIESKKTSNKLEVKVDYNTSWSLMYTSETTGKPKGVVKNHKGYYLLFAITSIELNINKSDKALLVMPMCHANSFNFFCSYIFSGASIFIYSKNSFDTDYFFFIIEKYKCNFTSLVPTHFIVILDYLKKTNKNNMIKHKSNFMISSTPVRKDTKKEILKYFKNANLFELYGSSEYGWVTMLHPVEQFDRLGTVGKECIGSKPIKILDELLNEVPDGYIGELYACPPYNFSHYWNNQAKTKEAFYNDYVSVGDLALRTEDGYIKLVDRKKNMIISCGENIYPSEVENVTDSHDLIKDVAVIGN